MSIKTTEKISSVSILQCANKHSRSHPMASEVMKAYMSPPETYNIQEMYKQVEEMGKLGRTRGSRRVDLTVAELLRLSVDEVIAIEPDLQRESIASQEWSESIISSQMEQSIHMWFHLCPVVGMRVGQYSILDGLQRWCALIKFFQGQIKTPELSNEFQGEVMTITNTDRVLEPSYAYDMHESRDDDVVNMMQDLADRVVSAEVHTPNMPQSERSFVFMRINANNNLSDGERLAGYQGRAAEIARKLEDENPFFGFLKDNNVSTGDRKQVFNEMSKSTRVEYQKNALQRDACKTWKNGEVLSKTKPVSQENLKKFALANPSDEETTPELYEAYKGVDRKYKFAFDVMNRRKGQLVGFTKSLKASGVCQWLSTWYLIPSVFEDIYGEKWDVTPKGCDIATGLDEVFKVLQTSMTKLSEKEMVAFEKRWNTKVMKDIKKTKYNDIKNASSTQEVEDKHNLIKSMVLHTEFRKYFPALPLDPRRVFPKAMQEKKYEEQAGVCPETGQTLSIVDMVAHHIIAHADGGRTDYDNLAMVCKIWHEKNHPHVYGSKRIAIADALAA